jgi:predicted lipoprotein with Yx(FWY)xxD motif
VAPQKRIFVAAAGALAATLALSACGSQDATSNAQNAAIKAAPAAVPAEDLVGGVPTDTSTDEPAQESDAVPTQKSDGAASDDTTSDQKADAAVTPKTLAKPAGKVTNKLIAKTVPRMGNVVTDAKGWVLYRFDKDKASPSKSNCVGDCAKIWPPLLADETLELSGVASSKVDTVEREDGGLQITIGGWPVYRYIGDKKPGSWKGQNVGGAWFVVQKDGRKNLTCLPKISKPVPLPVDPAKKAKKAGELAAVEDDSADTGSSSGY